MGLIHFHVRHYAMAVRFFQHALTFDRTATEVVDADEPPLYTIGATKRPEILYNLGIAMLHLQRPKEAFECLLIPLNFYHNNPKLWLRLAEACIMVHKQVRCALLMPLEMQSHDSNSFFFATFDLEFENKGTQKYCFVCHWIRDIQKVHH